MYKHVVIVAAMMLAMLMPLTVAGEDDKPTIAFLRYRHSSGSNVTVEGIWDMFQVYGLINRSERDALNVEEDIKGEHINVFFRSAGGDLPTANIMVEEALDREADIMLTISTPVSIIATKAAQEMDDPPLLFFSLVARPYSVGIASSPCIKPDYIAGTHVRQPYDLVVPLVQLQDPDIQKIGTFVNQAENNSVEGSAEIVAAGMALGLEVEVAAIVEAADIPIATQALLDKGVEAIVYAGAYLESFGVSAMASVTADYGVPTYGPPMTMAVDRGGMVGAGFKDYYREGIIVARMLIGHLNGTLDISTIALNYSPSLGVAVNLDAAAGAGIEISDELLAMAEYIVEDSEPTDLSVSPSLPEMTLEERMAEDAAFLAELECTPERIAEEQAALDAAKE